MPFTAVWDVLMYIVLPVWVIAGFLDYCCHRATDIEHATGVRESALHWLMLGEMGVPIVAAVFLEINALMFLFLVLCLIAHQVTGYIDLKVAMATRRVTAFEHQIHSFLETMPFAALLLLAILHWPQAQALFGLGDAHADFSVVVKQAPSWAALIPPFAGFTAFALLPYLEEFIRGLRAEARHEVATPRPTQD